MSLPSAPTVDGLYFLKVTLGVASWQLVGVSNPLFASMGIVDDGTRPAIVLSRDGGDPNALATNVAIRPGGYVLTNYFIAEAAFRLIDDGGTQHNVAMLDDTGVPTGIVFGETPIAGAWTNFMLGTLTDIRGFLRIGTQGANPVTLGTTNSAPSTSALVVADGDGASAADAFVTGSVHALGSFTPASIETIVSAAGPVTVAPSATSTLVTTGAFVAPRLGTMDLLAIATGVATGFVAVGEDDLIDLQLFANTNGGGDVLIQSINLSVTTPGDGSGGAVKGTSGLPLATSFAVARGDSVVFTLKATNPGAVNTIDFANIRLAARFFPAPT